MLMPGLTPLEDWTERFDLWVKREDLCCPPPGPPFSKTRGVWSHILHRPEEMIGALDTYHSQAGHAAARACELAGKRCMVFYPEYKGEPGPRDPQLRAQKLGATLCGLPAGRSAILYHQARKELARLGNERHFTYYMMPNALKLTETVEETAQQVTEEMARKFRHVVIPVSSGTIAAGVILGFRDRVGILDSSYQFHLHMGYSRSGDALKKYVQQKSGLSDREMIHVIRIVNEGYQYREKAHPGQTPPWPCNEYYDLKTFRWWMRVGRENLWEPNEVLFWNVG